MNSLNEKRKIWSIEQRDNQYYYQILIDLKHALNLIKETNYTESIEKITPFLEITKKIITEENNSLKIFLLNTLLDYFYDHKSSDGFKIIKYIQKYDDKKSTNSDKFTMKIKVNFF